MKRRKANKMREGRGKNKSDKTRKEDEEIKKKEEGE